MDTSAFLRHLETQSTYAGQIAHVEHIPSREATYAELDEPLPCELQDCLSKHGLLPLYTHQAEAVNKARQGRNVMVVYASYFAPIYFR